MNFIFSLCRDKVLVVFLCLITIALHTVAQQTDGSISGTVRDSLGTPLEGASVLALHTSSGTSFAARTDKRGAFYIPNLRIGGPYTVTVSYTGMKTYQQHDITVRLGTPLELQAVLTSQHAVLKEVVISTGKTKAPAANRYGSGMNISRTQIGNTPMISRSLQDVTRTVPQSSKDNSFAGTNFRYNNITIDGAINNDAIGFSPSAGGITGSSGTPGSGTRSNAISLDAIEDMQVYLAPFDVKIGNFTGGSINAVTRSGTNTVTGSVYGYGRNAGITGKDKAGTLGSMDQHFYDWQTGFRVGLPIVKNRLFFFTSEEITRRQDPAQLKAGQQEVAGILSSQDVALIEAETEKRYGSGFFGTAGAFNTSSESEKFFNRIDWNINERNQLSVRNNTIRSRSLNLDRDQLDFRFSSMAYQQTNNQVSTVAELKSRLSNGWSNSLIVGYTTIHDYRTPTADPSLPQVQIRGRTPGTTIYMGTDREASVFDMKQKTWEITNNLTWHTGKHTFLFGTHNELYNITYGFVNAWNGRVDYLSIEDYLGNRPYRVRGSYNYTNNTRAYLQNNPGAVFNVDLLSAYVQDEIKISERVQVTPGIRADYTLLPDKPDISERATQSMTDEYFGSTYYYTPLNRISNNYLNKLQLSPRIGFRYDITGNRKWILRGGVGWFTGRIPFAWLGYAYYNTGIHYGAYDQRADKQPFVAGTDPVKPSVNGIADFIAQNGYVVNNAAIGTTQIDVVNNQFSMPKVLRTNLAMEHTTGNDYALGIEVLYTKTIKDVFFQQINVKDDPLYYGFDRHHQMPVYSGSTDPGFTNVYQLSNTGLGHRFSFTGSIKKQFKQGGNFSLAYTYGQSKDVFNGIRNSMESNWQLNQALNPNNAGLAWSNFDIRHRVVGNIGYLKEWPNRWVSIINLFVSAQSGSPFTYGIVNYSLQGLSQQVSLAYIPESAEAVRFFQDVQQGNTVITAEQQAMAFNSYIDGNKYLRSRRGDFTERNTGRTPWNINADLHLAQEFHFGGRSKQFLTLSFDIMNVTNLISRNWGKVYFSPNTFNSTASVGLIPSQFPEKQNQGQYPVFTFSEPGKPYSIDYFGSRAQGQLGLRYNF